MFILEVLIETDVSPSWSSTLLSKHLFVLGERLFGSITEYVISCVVWDIPLLKKSTYGISPLTLGWYLSSKSSSSNSSPLAPQEVV